MAHSRFLSATAKQMKRSRIGTTFSTNLSTGWGEKENVRAKPSQAPRFEVVGVEEKFAAASGFNPVVTTSSQRSYHVRSFPSLAAELSECRGPPEWPNSALTMITCLKVTDAMLYGNSDCAMELNRLMADRPHRPADLSHSCRNRALALNRVAFACHHDGVRRRSAIASRWTNIKTVARVGARAPRATPLPE